MRSNFLALIIFVSVCCIAKTSSLHAQAPVINPMEEMLSGYLNNEIRAKKFKITYLTGDDYIGMTTMVLLGNGKYDILSNVSQGRKKVHFAGKIPKKEVKNLSLRMLTMKLWEFKHIKSHPATEEAIPSIEVSAKSESYEVVCYGSEVRFSMPFYTAQEMILDIIHRESNNVILEKGI